LVELKPQGRWARVTFWIGFSLGPIAILFRIAGRGLSDPAGVAGASLGLLLGALIFGYFV
jgi:hypothetical protein